MANNNNLIINLVGRTVAFSNAMGGASKMIDNLKAKVASTSKGIMSLGVQAVKYLAPLGAAGFVGWGVKLAAEAETAQTGFTTMLGSAEKAKALLSGLKTFAASTPFEFPELRKSAQSLLSFGVDAGQVQARLKTLGDVASGSSSSIEDLALIYGKTLAKGKFELEQGNQLAERGIPIYSTLAKQLGITQAELMKQISAGKVSAQQVQKAFQSMAGSGGIFENAMEKQSKTLAGMWSTLMDNIGQIATSIGEFLIECFGLKDVLSSFNDFSGSITATLEYWKPVAVGVKGVVVAAFDGIKNSLSLLAYAFTSLLQPVIDWLGSTFNSGMESWRDTAVAVFATIEYVIANWQKFWQVGFESAWLSLLTFKNNFVNIFTAVLPAIFNNFGASIQQFFVGLATNVANIVSELWNYITTLGDDQIEFTWTPLIIDEVAKAFDRELTKEEKALAESIKQQKEALVQGLGQFVNQKVDAVKNAGKDAMEKLEGKAAYDQEGETKAKENKKDLNALTKGSLAAATAINAANKVSAEAKELAKIAALDKENNKSLKAIEKNTKGGLGKAKV